MSSFIENNDMQREPRFVYEQANTTEFTAREAVPTPSIKVPFPPPISPEDLVKKNGEVPSRSPNAFLIYRRVVVKELQAQNYAYKMTDVSSMASAFWKREPEYVKKAYLQIAGEAKNMLTNTRHKTLSFSRRKWHNSNTNNTRNPKTKTSTPQQPRKKQTNTNTTKIPQTSQPLTPPEPKHHQFIQPLTISTNQHTNQHIFEEDRQLFSPSFAISMDDVDSYLFATSGRDFIWTQSSVSDVLAYSDGESSSSTDVGIDDLFDQPNLTSTLSILNPQKMTKLSYKRFMLAWHLQHLQHFQLFYGNISPVIVNNELDTININDQLH